jgi:peptidoglycan/LPS O-acetylase OafA/YrhL
MDVTIDKTNTLKGITIIIVLFNHYLNMNVAGNTSGFANLWIVVFLVLSGYGIQLSLSRSSNREKKLNHLKYIKFYYLRAIRIFPLYLAAYLTECLLFQKHISPLAILGISAPGHYWFIPAILQCYLIAPLIHIIMKKQRLLLLLILISSFLLVNVYLNSNYAPGPLISLLKKIHLDWRGIFFLYLLIFSLSMFIPKIESGWNEISKDEKIFYYYFLIFVILASMILVKYNIAMPAISTFITVTLYPMLIIIISSIYCIINRINIPVVSFIGSISYSIYLFHITFYLSISKYLGLRKDSLLELCLIFILFPLFIYVCKKIEMLSYFMVRSLKNE